MGPAALKKRLLFLFDQRKKYFMSGANSIALKRTQKQQ